MNILQFNIYICNIFKKKYIYVSNIYIYLFKYANSQKINLILSLINYYLVLNEFFYFSYSSKLNILFFLNTSSKLIISNISNK